MRRSFFSVQKIIYSTVFSVALICTNSLSHAEDPKPETPAEKPAEAATSETPTKPEEKPLYATPQERDDALLASAKPDEIKHLETPSEKFIALYKAAEAAEPKGTFFIVHTPELPQRWPAPLETVRRNTPFYGWNTFALPLPQKDQAAPPKRDEAPAATTDATTDETKAAPEPATEEKPAEKPEEKKEKPTKPAIPREQRINERADAALTAIIKDLPGNLVVVVDNSSAPDALTAIAKKLSQGGSSGMKALILINLQTQEALTKEQLDGIFAAPDLPIMDVFFDVDDKFQQDQRRLHRGQALRKKLVHYQQTILPPEHLINIDEKQGFWMERARGFAEKNANDKIIR